MSSSHSKKFSKDTLEQIKGRISLRDVISKHVTGMTRKGNDWWACCPFHHEKTPSFHIHEARGYYHCFGCGAHGNVFDFVNEMRGGSFADTVVYLAELTGVRLEEVVVDPQAEQKKLTGLSVLEKSATFFTKSLKGAGLNYMKARGLSLDIVEEFRLGYAPEGWAELTNTLSAQGAKMPMLIETGMSIKGNKGTYDRFRNRVMFPIQNLEGKVIGFGGRVLDGGEPKYLNSPETPFFNKRYTLYNLNRAREAIRKEKQALVVEGYMDVIGLWQQGIKTAVAPLGTAITEDQVKLLWRFYDAPTVCLDGDLAGRGAAVRVAKRVLSVLEPGRTLKFVWMPEGEDPDSYVKKYGKEAFLEILQNPVSLEDVLWQSLVQGRTLQKGEDRAAIEQDIVDMASTITHELIKKHFVSALKGRIWQKKSGKKEDISQKVLKRRMHTEEQARILLSILFKKPELFERVSEKLSDVTVENQQLNGFLHILFQLFASTGLERESLDDYLVGIGMMDDVKKMLASPLVSRTPEVDLEALWESVYKDLSATGLKEKRLATAQVTESLFSENGEDAWEKLKALHQKRQ